eukprot:10183326-Prorocentrum_lima.AAC.1
MQPRLRHWWPCGPGPQGMLYSENFYGSRHNSTFAMEAALPQHTQARPRCLLHPLLAEVLQHA